MNKPWIKKGLITIALLLCVLASHFNWLDSLAEKYTEQGIKRTLITYAVARSLNGVISVAQGTELAISPAGVGLTFTPGQILDPVNDLIERFSWVVMVSGSSLGIQRLFLEMSSSVTVISLLTVLVAAYLITLFFYQIKTPDAKYFKNILSKALVLVLFIRFSVPLIAVVNEGLYAGYLQPQYEEAQLQLESASDQIQLINKSSKVEVEETEDGLLAKLEQWLDKTQKSFDIETQMHSLKQAAEDISQQVINMIVVFVVQTIIFPLLFLWVLVKGAKGVMGRFSV